MALFANFIKNHLKPIVQSLPAGRRLRNPFDYNSTLIQLWRPGHLKNCKYCANTDVWLRLGNSYKCIQLPIAFLPECGLNPFEHGLWCQFILILAGHTKITSLNGQSLLESFLVTALCKVCKIFSIINKSRVYDG